MNYRNSQPLCTQNRGFSLVELMVGMSIGLLVVIVILQSFSVFETQKRTTTAGSDTQSSGLMAMTQLEQEIRNSGAGFTSDSAFSCDTTYSYYDDGSGTVTVPAPGFSNTLAPVEITDGGTGSDTITIKSGTSFLGSIPAGITKEMPNSSSILDVSFTQGFVVPSKIIVSQNGHCTLMQLTQVLDASLKLQHNPGGAGASWNPPASFYNTAPGNTWPGAGSGPLNYGTDAKILNIGDLVIKTYSVDANNNLQVLDSSTNLAANATYPLVKDIVNLQAEYGVSTGAGVQPVSSWVPATGTWGTLNAAEIKRIKAIRLTLVARSGKKEITDVTTAAPGGVNVSNLTDWRQYRYRVYTTIIPLRNIIWSNI